jgi:hypothetical protein
MKTKSSESGLGNAFHLLAVMASGAVSVEALSAMVLPILNSTKLLATIAPASAVSGVLSPGLAVLGGVLGYIVATSKENLDETSDVD